MLGISSNKPMGIVVRLGAIVSVSFRYCSNL